MRLCPWLQEESPADGRRADIGLTYGVADGPKRRTARHETARDGTRKRVTFELDGSRGKVIIGTGAKENPSKDSDLRSRNTRLDHRSSRERSSGEKSRKHNSVDATNQGGRKEAAIRDFVKSKNEQGKAAKGKAAKQSNVEQKWRGLLSQQRSFVNNDAAAHQSVREVYDARERWANENLEEEKGAKKGSAVDSSREQAFTSMEAIGYKPMAVPAMRDDVEGEHLAFEFIDDPSGIKRPQQEEGINEEIVEEEDEAKASTKQYAKPEAMEEDATAGKNAYESASGRESVGEETSRKETTHSCTDERPKSTWLRLL